MAEKVMLIDGNSIANRAFYGIPLLSNSQGAYTNAVYGFLNILFKLMEEENPDYLAVAFDLKEPTFRHKHYEQYKGTRKEMPNELRMQMPMLKDLLSAMDIKQYQMEGYEADDILGTLSKQAESKSIVPVIISGDRDMLQLASDTLKIRIPKTRMGKTEVEDYYARDVIEKYGVTPTEFIDVKALMGDISDNIPGVPGIGEKTATKIIQEYKNIEMAIENAMDIKPKKASENLQTYKDQAILSKFLATIERNMPIEADFDEMKISDIITPVAYEMMKQLEFKSILAKMNIDGFNKANNDSIDLEKEYITISDETMIKEFIKEISGKESAYIVIEENNKLIGVSFYNEEVKGVWIEAKNDLDDIKLSKLLKDYFVNEKTKKIAHNGKKDIHVLRGYGYEINGIKFDTAIAGYVINPTRETYNFDDISSEFLGKSYPSEEEVLGKGKSKKSVTDLEQEERMNYAILQAEICYVASKIMSEKIKESEQEELFYDIEMPLLYVLSDMEKYGMKINKSELLVYQSQLDKSIKELTEDIYEMSGEEFNINSPKQMGYILFEKLGLQGGKKTKTGYSTSAEVLEKLKLDNPIIDKILLYRQISKLKSTYADGLLNVMDKNTDKIYSTFNQTITATGRISSTEPNLQNIPIRLNLGRELRKVFIPTSDEYIFLDADYSQIELRILAHISNDETLINAFRNGQDIHTITASQVLNIPFEEVTSRQRNDAKAINFGIVYGIGSFSLSEDLGITRKEAQEYIDEYFAKYPNIKIYMDKTIKEAKENGYVSTIFNRRRAMPELSSSNFNLRSFGERVAMNMPIQGSAADIIKIAMVKVSKRLKSEKLKSKLILQVHDELLIEAHKNEKDYVKKLLKYEMETAVLLRVPIDVDIYEGNTWYDTK